MLGIMSVDDSYNLLPESSSAKMSSMTCLVLSNMYQKQKPFCKQQVFQNNMHTKLETKNHTQKLCLSYRNPENIKLTTKVAFIQSGKVRREFLFQLNQGKLGKVREFVMSRKFRAYINKDNIGQEEKDCYPVTCFHRPK